MASPLKKILKFITYNELDHVYGDAPDDELNCGDLVGVFKEIELLFLGYVVNLNPNQFKKELVQIQVCKSYSIEAPEGCKINVSKYKYFIIKQ